LRSHSILLSDASQALSTSMQTLTLSAQEQGETLSLQLSALQDTHRSAEDIRNTSRFAARSADTVLQVVERAEEISRAGESAIEQTLGGFGTVRDQVAEMAQQFADLQQKAQQIEGITETVKELADQSNVLALNAAIEAARSGEHGKGFAVVATEIRRLSDQSIRSTQQVKRLLGEMASAVNTAVGTSREGAVRVETGLEQVRASGQTLKELSGIIRDNSTAVRPIAQAVAEQDHGIERIFTSVTEVNRIMNETMRRLEITNQSVKTLEDVSQKMIQMANRYRV
jgi:methyl-accepting chemotaxis protein